MSRHAIVLPWNSYLTLPNKNVLSVSHHWLKYEVLNCFRTNLGKYLWNLSLALYPTNHFQEGTGYVIAVASIYRRNAAVEYSICMWNRNCDTISTEMLLFPDGGFQFTFPEFLFALDIPNVGRFSMWGNDTPRRLARSIVFVFWRANLVIEFGSNGDLRVGRLKVLCNLLAYRSNTFV